MTFAKGTDDKEIIPERSGTEQNTWGRCHKNGRRNQEGGGIIIIAKSYDLITPHPDPLPGSGARENKGQNFWQAVYMRWLRKGCWVIPYSRYLL
jgi:hypothetical protein